MATNRRIPADAHAWDLVVQGLQRLSLAEVQRRARQCTDLVLACEQGEAPAMEVERATVWRREWGSARRADRAHGLAWRLARPDRFA